MATEGTRGGQSIRFTDSASSQGEHRKVSESWQQKVSVKMQLF